MRLYTGLVLWRHCVSVLYGRYRDFYRCRYIAISLFFSDCAGVGAAHALVPSLVDVIPDIPDGWYDNDPASSAASSSAASLHGRAVGAEQESLRRRRRHRRHVTATSAAQLESREVVVRVESGEASPCGRRQRQQPWRIADGSSFRALSTMF